MKQAKQTFMVCILTMFLSGCTYYADLFFINNTNENIILTIKLNDDIEHIRQEDYKIQMLTAPEITNAEIDYESFKDSIAYIVIDTRTIQCRLTPKSTILLGGHYNSFPKQFETFRLERDSKTIEYTNSEIEEQCDTPAKLFPPFYYVFTISD